MGDMKHKLRILNLEDTQDDSELVRVRLVREGIECDLVHVETRDDFVTAIEGGGFDLILADYSLPSFDGLSALNIAKRKCPEVPFIFLSGAIGEEFAIETLERGATDYILKGSVSRLAAAIIRALLEVEEHNRRRQAEKELEKCRKHLEKMVIERTSELKKVNEQLQLELVARKKLEEQMQHKWQCKPERETIPSETEGKREERVCERYATDASLPAEIVASGRAVIKNISASGIALRTSQRLAKNTIYKIAIRSAIDEELSCHALVAWSSLMGKVAEKDKDGPLYETGLRFIHPNNSLIRSLENLIADKVTLSCFWERVQDCDGWP